jgi:hypothetical protein
MKTPILFALALIWSTGALAQQTTSETEPQEKTEKSTAVPSTIDFQGRLHDSDGNPVNATLLITFTLYDMLAGGSILWSEDFLVEIMDGLFQVKLGQINPITPDLFVEPDRWLGIRIGGEAELSPRTKISSAGYALQAPENDPTWLGAPELYNAIGRTGNVGIGTHTPTALLHTHGNETGGGNVLFVGEYKATDPGDPPATGEGTRMMWYPDKAAFRAGGVYSNEWDKGNIGDYSIALGYGTAAIGQGCVAMGYFTLAGGQVTTALGNNTTAFGWNSSSMGSGTIANASNSLVIGQYNLGLGHYEEWIPTDPIFEIGIGASDAERANAMTVLKNGNVGIGNTSPTGKLEVAGGDAIINDLTVGKGGGSHLANSALGFSALASNTTGIYNTAVGNATMFNNQSGEKNSAFGFRALFSNTTGKGNTANGIWALFSNTTGSSNVAIGVGALYHSTDRSHLVAIGDSALFHNGQGVNVYDFAEKNIAIGSKALYSNTGGSYNTAIGHLALKANTDGYHNTAIGLQALYLNTTGYHNTANGSCALRENTIGNYNTANGAFALASNTIGNYNTANGLSALELNTTGDKNTAIGYTSGFPSVPALKLTGQKNTFIGYNTTYSVGTITNSTALGANVMLTHSNTVILGNEANVGIGTSNPAYKLDIAGALNLNKGIASGVALRINGAETILYNGTYFSFGFGNSGNYSVFGRSLCIGTTSNPGTHLLVVNGTAAKPGGGSWETWSDINLKTLHGNYERGLNEISALVPVRYSYNEENPLDLPSQREFIGLIAQDVQEFLPEAVSVDQSGYLLLDMNPVNVAMINAIKELKAENDELKARLERLERALESLSEK